MLYALASSPPLPPSSVSPPQPLLLPFLLLVPVVVVVWDIGIAGSASARESRSVTSFLPGRRLVFWRAFVREFWGAAVLVMRDRRVVCLEWRLVSLVGLEGGVGLEELERVGVGLWGGRGA